MVFHCRCFSCSLKEEETEYETATPVASTSAQTFYTASSNFNPSVTNSQAKTYLLSNNLKEFTFSELKAVTNNFSLGAKIGEGGFGCVYKGVIKNPQDSTKTLDVVVKYLSRTGLKGIKTWVTEVNVLAIAEHPNLVKLVGYCVEDNEGEMQRLLVYEYMPNGSVEDHLSIKSEAPLSWNTRLKVAQDASCGLAYLHEDLQMIFRDLKSCNILLDDQWNAKLSDFGLDHIERLTYDVTTAAIGAIGYMAPECIETGHLTSKCDVWSYGVFLYELITGRLPIDTTRPENEQKLLEWVKPYLDSKRFELIIDPRLKNNYSLESAQNLSVIANKCLAILDPNSRPKMSEVLEMVNKLIAEDPTQAPQTTEKMKDEGETGSTKIQRKESVCFSLVCCRRQP